MASTSLTVWFEAVDSEPRTGMWCDRCNLPSGVGMTFSMRPGNNGPLSLCTIARCVDCCEPVQP